MTILEIDLESAKSKLVWLKEKLARAEETEGDDFILDLEHDVLQQKLEVQRCELRLKAWQDWRDHHDECCPTIT